MNFFKISILFYLIVFFYFLSEAQVERRIITKYSINSKILNEKRPILVSLPTAYNSSNEEYFVIYVLDGNLNTSFTSGIAELLYQSGYPKVIIVGIPNTFRSRDLTPTSWREAPSGGGATQFMNFMKKELIPYINDNFRALSFKVLIGHSFGGLFATHVLYQDPQLFDGYIAITPSVFYDNEYSLQKLKNLFKEENDLSQSIFFSVGKEPGIEGDVVFKMHEMFKNYAPKSLPWKFEYYPKENHSTVPLVATLDGLRYIFKDYLLSLEEVKKKGLPLTIQYYEKLSRKYKTKIKIPQRILMDYGYSLMEKEQYSKAIEVFEYYIQLYPDMIIPYEALSVIYEQQNKIQLAISNLEKVLKILPSYQDALIRLKKLKPLEKE